MSTNKWRAEHQAQMKSYRRKHYAANKTPYLSRSKAQRLERAVWMKDLKTNMGCARCPERFWACLDFHHVGKKLFTINDGMRLGYSKARILCEILKCVLLCANCHRKEHFGESKIMVVGRTPNPCSVGSSPASPAMCQADVKADIKADTQADGYAGPFYDPEYDAPENQ